MSSHLFPRQAYPKNWSRTSKAEPITPISEWRCTGCGKLLGIGQDGRLHLRFARGHEYLVGFPVQATCRGCGTLNHASALAR